MTISLIKILSDLVSTSVAAYGNLNHDDDNNNNNNDDDKLKKNLSSGDENPKFTKEQADAFVKKYQLLHHQENVNANGFSASVFKDKETGKHIIAMRGTDEVINDALLADVASIVGNGFANTQAVEMYRHYKKLTTPGGALVQYTETEKLQLFAIDNSLLIPLSLIHHSLTSSMRLKFESFKQSLAQDKGIYSAPGSNAPVLSPDELVYVTGHSLGGHLAVLFAYLLPDKVEQVVTLNAPGFVWHGAANRASPVWRPMVILFPKWEQPGMVQKSSLPKKIKHQRLSSTILVAMAMMH